MDNPYPTCDNCVFAAVPLDKYPCRECYTAFIAQRIKPNFVSKRKPKTNYDRIISKTPEELAKCIANIECEPTEACAGKSCDQCILEWLKQEGE